MGINPDALFLDLQNDLSHYLEQDNVSGAASKALLASFYKKFVDNEAADAEKLAFDKFISANERCKTWKVDDFTDEQQIFLGELRSTLHRFEARSGLGCLSWNHLYDGIRCGPGASVGARGGDFYTKVFDSPLSCTKSSLFEIYNLVSKGNPRWLSAESARFANYGGPKVVEGNSLSFVPKTNVIKRSICTEPNINMMFQLSLGDRLVSSLKTIYGLDLAIQPDKNRELARVGSVTSQYGTIDLESASDTIALSMCRYILPKSFLSLLEFLRCPVTFYKGDRIELHMMSTMGNGFTFPLQTLIFAAVVITVARIRGFPLRYPRNCLGTFGVFGDDIIVDREIYDDVCLHLGLLGFKVNNSKSFNAGPFRESCGHDYYSGHNIRGVYVKTLRSVQDRFVLVNRLLDWTARTGIPVRAVVSRLLSSVPFYPVPLGENDDAGIKVPYLYLKKRVRCKKVQSIMYKRWVAQSTSLNFSWEYGAVGTPKGERRRRLNIDGAYISFLQGSLRSYRIPIRHDKVRYEKRTGISPNWDYIPMGLGAMLPVGLTSLETAFLLNCENQ